MTLLEFTIPGVPVAKQRPRFGRGRTYTPAPTVHYENLVKAEAFRAMRGAEPLEQPLRLEVFIDLEAPRSWSRKRQGEAFSGDIRATKKPDASNVVKGIEDGMNGVVFRDDSQVVELLVEKGYAPSPCVRVRVLDAGGRRAP